MSSRWFRFYDEVVEDPKVQTLPAEVFRMWVNMLCIASKTDGILPPISMLAFHLRCEETVVERTIERLLNGGLIDRRNGGTNGYHYAPHGWDKRQYKSDTSTDRVKRFRQKKETGPDTETEAESEDNTDVLSKRAAPKPAKAKPKTKVKQNAAPKKTELPLHSLPDSWQPSPFGVGSTSRSIIDDWPLGQLELQSEKFQAHHRAKGTKFKNWQDAWSTWVLNSVSFGRLNNGTGSSNQRAEPISYNPMIQAILEIRAERAGGNQSVVQSDAGNWA